MERFLVFDLGQGEDDRYTIIDAKIIVFDQSRFWVNVASFGDNPFSKDLSECGSALMLPYDKYKQLKETEFYSLGDPIKFKDLPLQAQKFANKFLKECDNPQTNFEHFEETGE